MRGGNGTPSVGRTTIKTLSLIVAVSCALALAYVAEPPPEWLWVFVGQAMLTVHAGLWWTFVFWGWQIDVETTLLVLVDVVLMGEMRMGEAYVEKIRSAIIIRMIIYFVSFSITSR
jgi:hypothetical protein